MQDHIKSLTEVCDELAMVGELEKEEDRVIIISSWLALEPNSDVLWKVYQSSSKPASYGEEVDMKRNDTIVSSKVRCILSCQECFKLWCVYAKAKLKLGY